MPPDPYSIFGETDEEDEDEAMDQPRMRLIMDDDDIEEEMFPEDEDEDDDEFYDIDDDEDDEDGEGGIMEEDDEVEEEDDDEDDDEDGSGRQTFTIRGDTNGTVLAQIRALLSGPHAGSGAQQSALIRRLISSGVMQPTARAVLTPAERAQKEAERRRREKWWSPQIKPHPHGKELLCGGEFGRVGNWGEGYERDGRRRPRQKESMRFGAIPRLSKVGILSFLGERICAEIIGNST